MLPFILALQLGGASPAPAPSVPPPPGATTPLPPPLVPPEPTPSAGNAPWPPPALYPPGYAPYPPGYAPYPPGYAPYPPGYAPPPGYGGYPQAPPVTTPPVELPTLAPLPRWFARAQIGLGPSAFTEETRLLRLDGYGGIKVWFEADGGYMPELASRHVGVGLWGAISYLTSSPSDIAASLEELDYFVGAEIPIRFGGRALAMIFAPRLGFAGGKVSLGAGVPSQNAFVWGAQIGAFSSDYHVGAAIGMLSAAVGPPGSGGRDHDLGGLVVSLGGMFDER